MPNLAEGPLWYLAFLFSIVVHEASHALAAMKMGDMTAYNGGQVSLDPLPRIKREPFGTVVVPLLSFLVAGWMIGWASTPYDPLWARAYPQRSAKMSLAGPLANLFVALAIGLLIRLGILAGLFHAPDSINFTHIVGSAGDGFLSGVTVFISMLFSMNILLFVFNMIPLPPLDGSGVIPLLLTSRQTGAYIDFISTGPLSFIGLVFAWKVFEIISDPVHLFFVNLLYPEYGYH